MSSQKAAKSAKVQESSPDCFRQVIAIAVSRAEVNAADRAQRSQRNGLGYYADDDDQRMGIVDRVILAFAKQQLTNRKGKAKR